MFSGCFDTSGSMIPRLVPEISPCDGFCDGQAAVVVGGIGHSRILMDNIVENLFVASFCEVACNKLNSYLISLISLFHQHKTSHWETKSHKNPYLQYFADDNEQS